MAVVTMRQLLESGVHFGHQTRRWNPKMKRFIFTERNGIYIIDLQQSLSYIDRAYEFVKETVAHGGIVLFVGTKKQAQEAIAEQATRVGMPYVNQRWLGGMLTNFQTVHKRLQRLKELEEHRLRRRRRLRHDQEGAARPAAGEGQARQDPRRHPRHEPRCPSAVWIVDTKKEHIAVDEAHKLGIPSSRSSTPTATPTRSTTRSRATTTRSARSPAHPGHRRRRRRRPDARAGAARRADDEAEPASSWRADEPLADWERELLTGDTAAAARGARRQRYRGCRR